jgi:hypothetical protein
LLEVVVVDLVALVALDLFLLLLELAVVVLAV